MKTAKQKQKVTIVGLVTAIICLLMFTTAMTFAYFTARNSAESGAMQFGTLEIRVNNVGVTKEAEHELMPGCTVSLAGTITLGNSTIDAFVRIKPEVNITVWNGTSLTKANAQAQLNNLVIGAFEKEVNSTKTGDFIRATGNNTYLYYTGKFTPSTIYDFTTSNISFKIDENTFGNDWQGAVFTVKITAEAIQADHVGVTLTGTAQTDVNAIANAKATGETDSAWDGVSGANNNLPEDLPNGEQVTNLNIQVLTGMPESTGVSDSETNITSLDDNKVTASNLVNNTNVERTVRVCGNSSGAGLLDIPAYVKAYNGKWYREITEGEFESLYNNGDEFVFKVTEIDFVAQSDVLNIIQTSSPEPSNDGVDYGKLIYEAIYSFMGIRGIKEDAFESQDFAIYEPLFNIKRTEYYDENDEQITAEEAQQQGIEGVVMCYLTDSYQQITANSGLWQSLVSTKIINKNHTYSEIKTAFINYCQEYGISEVENVEEAFIIVMESWVNDPDDGAALDIADKDYKVGDDFPWGDVPEILYGDYFPLFNNNAEIDYDINDSTNYYLWKKLCVLYYGDWDHLRTVAEEDAVDAIEAEYTNVIGYFWDDCFNNGLNYNNGGGSGENQGGSDPLIINENITSIAMPSTITNIGSRAFAGCTGLAAITIPSSVEIINTSAFNGCNSLLEIAFESSSQLDLNDTDIFSLLNSINTLQRIVLPDCVTEIPVDAFVDNTCLTDIIIPSSVTNIGDYAFGGCSSLTSITIPNSVTSIGEWAFHSCGGLSSITIPNSVTSIGSMAFYGCSGLTSISVDNGNTTYDSRENSNAIIETSTNTLILGCKNSTIPDTITSIGNSAFYQCSGLTSITIPNSVTSIGSMAFYDCNALASVSIPSSVASIGSSAFSTVTLVEVSGAYATKNALNSLFSSLPSKFGLVITGDITSIPNQAFYNCSQLRSVTISSPVTSIGDQAFGNCSNLERIVIPESVTSIGINLLWSCNKITSVTIPFVGDTANSTKKLGYIFGRTSNDYNPTTLKTVTLTNCTSIPTSAFAKCTNITTINLPSNLTAIGNAAFFDCSSLGNIVIPSGVVNIGTQAFDGCTNLTFTKTENGINYLGKVGNDYYIAFSASDKTMTSYTLNSSTRYLYDYLFSGCTNLIEFTMPNFITGTGISLFNRCTNLSSISFANGCQLTEIRLSTFSGCTGLTEIVIPDYFTKIGPYAFAGCTSLTSLSIPNCDIGLKETSIDSGGGSIGSSGYIISGCSSLTTINFRNVYSTTKAFGDYTFAGNTCYLTDITIPSNYTTLPSYGFRNCTTLENVTILGGTILPVSIFEGCTGLKEVNLETIATIKSRAFYGCGNLHTVTAPCLVRIEDNAFKDCSKLVNINGSGEANLTHVHTVGSQAFGGCGLLTNINLGSLSSIGGSAFYDCVNIEKISFTIGGSNLGNFGKYFGASTNTGYTTVQTNAGGSQNTYKVPTKLQCIELLGGFNTYYFPYMFHNFTTLRKVVFKSESYGGNASFGDCAFAGCSNVETIVINDSRVANSNKYLNMVNSGTNIYVKDGLTIGTYLGNTNQFSSEVIVSGEYAGYTKYTRL